jgi:hypothetical protein
MDAGRGALNGPHYPNSVALTRSTREFGAVVQDVLNCDRTWPKTYECSNCA